MGREVPVLLPCVGRLFGRGAVFADGFAQQFQTVKLTGGVNSEFGSQSKGQRLWMGFECVFAGVLFARITELDVFLKQPDFFRESVAKIEGSELLAELGLTEPHRHFVVQSYDWVYEVVATEMDWRWLG